MKHIRDAILARDSGTVVPAQELAALPVPEHYRAVTVHKDEADMFQGRATRDKDPRQSLHVEDVPTPELGP
ncbi:MAG: crotonyl-CoA reductase, partial [Actinomycetota bacterium]|nr:crotonyl-CoA reductase [Actinomycetota bacterium]